MKLAISYDSIQEYIIDNDLTDQDTILLHPTDYDKLATQFAEENNIMIFRSLEILGVNILEDTSDEIKRNHILVMAAAAS